MERNTANPLRNRVTHRIDSAFGTAQRDLALLRHDIEQSNVRADPCSGGVCGVHAAPQKAEIPPEGQVGPAEGLHFHYARACVRRIYNSADCGMI